MISDFISNLGSTGWVTIGVLLLICEITLITVAGTGFGYFLATGLGAFIIGIFYKIELFSISTNLGFILLTWAGLSLLLGYFFQTKYIDRFSKNKGEDLNSHSLRDDHSHEGSLKDGDSEQSK